MNAGWFQKGHDERRHVFTPDECRKGGTQPTCHRLTNEHRSKGGRAAWARQMAESRLKMNLPLPTEAVREAVAKLIDEHIPF
jgi:hypothetical protein